MISLTVLFSSKNLFFIFNDPSKRQALIPMTSQLKPVRQISGLARFRAAAQTVMAARLLLNGSSKAFTGFAFDHEEGALPSYGAA